MLPATVYDFPIYLQCSGTCRSRVNLVVWSIYDNIFISFNEAPRMTRTACPLIIIQNADTTWELLDFCSEQKSILSLLLRRSGSCERIFEDQDDWVTPEEHLRDESVLVDWLRLLFAWACCMISRRKGLERRFDQGMVCVKSCINLLR